MLVKMEEGNIVQSYWLVMHNESLGQVHIREEASIEFKDV